jgi:hypothetical protein
MYNALSRIFPIFGRLGMGWSPFSLVSRARSCLPSLKIVMECTFGDGVADIQKGLICAKQLLQLFNIIGRMKVEPAVKNAARIDEAFFGRVRVQIKNHLVTLAITLLPFGRKMIGIFLLGLGGVLESQAEMPALPLEIGVDRFAGKIVGHDGIAGQDARTAVWKELTIYVREDNVGGGFRGRRIRARDVRAG